MASKGAIRRRGQLLEDEESIERRKWYEDMQKPLRVNYSKVKSAQEAAFKEDDEGAPIKVVRSRMEEKENLVEIRENFRSSWIIPMNSTREYDTVIFAFPGIGGTISMFTSLAQKLQVKKVKVYGICYPGHLNRVHETFAPSTRYIVYAVKEELMQMQLFQLQNESVPKRIVLLGHCVGGLICYDLCRVLLNDGYRVDNLFIAGCKSPLRAMKYNLTLIDEYEERFKKRYPYIYGQYTKAVAESASVASKSGTGMAPSSSHSIMSGGGKSVNTAANKTTNTANTTNTMSTLPPLKKFDFSTQTALTCFQTPYQLHSSKNVNPLRPPIATAAAATSSSMSMHSTTSKSTYMTHTTTVTSSSAGSAGSTTAGTTTIPHNISQLGSSLFTQYPLDDDDDVPPLDLILHTVPNPDLLIDRMIAMGAIPKSLRRRREMLSYFCTTLQADAFLLENYMIEPPFIPGQTRSFDSVKEEVFTKEDMLENADMPPSLFKINVPIVTMHNAGDVTCAESDLIAWSYATSSAHDHHLLYGDLPPVPSVSKAGMEDIDDEALTVDSHFLSTAVGQDEETLLDETMEEKEIRRKRTHYFLNHPEAVEILIQVLDNFRENE